MNTTDFDTVRDAIRRDTTSSIRDRAYFAIDRIETENMRLKFALESVMEDHRVAGWPKTNGIRLAESAL